MTLYSVNYLAVIIAVILQMAIGWFWYSQSGFGKKWIKLMNFSSKDMNDKKNEGMGKSMSIGIVAALIMVIILYQILVAFSVASVLQAIEVGILVWLGFIATVSVGSVLWDGKPWGLFAINAGYYLVVLVVNSIILYIF